MKKIEEEFVLAQEQIKHPMHTETIGLLLGLILVKDLVLRWFSITQRRLTFVEIMRNKAAQAENLEKEASSGAAKASALVLDTPKPQAVFLGFGDNSLNFELRVFINGIDDWIPVLHKLNQTVDREFRKAGITISFPQRDVHLD